HARYLEKAKEHGDLLIVGVDSDELTKQRKGPDRPIVPLKERLKMLVHLRHVDIVTVRNAGEGIGDLIRAVKPDVLIVSKSTKDFTKKMKVEYKNDCKKIVDLPPQATTSTSARIRQVAIEGANSLAKEVKDLTEDFIKRLRA
ncbi:MAG: adenylyltransferase/cytidyltransferase family protein, partial [Candidatus Paceibacterota bacterium]